jgi:hypothetical protein
MTTQAEEVPFLTGMEREPEAEKSGWSETRVTVDARKLFQGDGMMWQLLRKIRLAMAALSDRGHEDYELSDYERGVRAGSRHITYANGDSREPNGEKRLLTWILGVLGLLLVGGVGSVVAMYGKLSSIEKGQEGHEHRLNRLEADRDQRYRGANAASP